MNKYIFPLMLISSIIYADPIEVKGIGSTSEEARKNAVINAIKEKVGELVINKEVINDDFYNEKTISYSDASVKKIKIKEENIVDGVYHVTSLVDIESEKLIDEMRAKNIIIKKGVINTSDLKEALSHFDKKDVEKNNKISFEDLVKEYLIEPVKNNEKLMEIDFSGEINLVEDKIPSEFKSEDVVRCSFEPVVPFEIVLRMGPSLEYVSRFKKILTEIGDSNGTRIREINLFSGGEDYHFVSREKIGIIQHMENNFLYSPSGGRIKIELLNKEGKLIDSAVTSGEYPTKFITRFRADQGFSRNSIFAFRPDLQNFVFFSGMLKIKAYIFLTKEQIENLDTIRIMETGERETKVVSYQEC